MLKPLGKTGPIDFSLTGPGSAASKEPLITCTAPQCDQSNWKLNWSDLFVPNRFLSLDHSLCAEQERGGRGGPSQLQSGALKGRSDYFLRG